MKDKEEDQENKDAEDKDLKTEDLKELTKMEDLKWKFNNYRVIISSKNKVRDLRCQGKDLDKVNKRVKDMKDLEVQSLNRLNRKDQRLKKIQSNYRLNKNSRILRTKNKGPMYNNWSSSIDQ